MLKILYDAKKKYDQYRMEYFISVFLNIVSNNCLNEL